MMIHILREYHFAITIWGLLLLIVASSIVCSTTIYVLKNYNCKIVLNLKIFDKKYKIICVGLVFSIDNTDELFRVVILIK